MSKTTMTILLSADIPAGDGTASADDDAPFVILDKSGRVFAPTDFGAPLGRGEAGVGTADDDLAADGRALLISGREQAWNGAQWDCEKFRGNEIEVIGSFRSANPAVKVSVQFTVNGYTSYNNIFTVITNDGAYSGGNGKFRIPANAEQIYVYIESDNLRDIYADDFRISVSGRYKYCPVPEQIRFADTSSYPSLKEIYKDDFIFGTCISRTLTETPEYSKLMLAQFGSVTCENSMKPESLLDMDRCLSDPARYNESPAVDLANARAELDFAQKHGLKVRAHTLVWHSQTPDRLFYENYDIRGKLADRSLMLKRMENYIRTVMQLMDEKYPGLVYAWDVVNEAADDAGGMRKSLWYQTIGDDYIAHAFAFARRYAPKGAKLVYNDYNCYIPSKQEDMLEFLRPAAQAGNIDGVGMQSHLKTDVSLDTYFDCLKRFNAELGVEIQVTELDIGCSGSTPEEQGEYYREYFRRLLEVKKDVPVTSVTVWGLSDGMTWRTSEQPLLFNADLSRKPAFDGTVKAKN
ncbi:MAG: endo-1,4-beta-xylanase [Oscillospiraceae bacterium]|nr:endo-1,4-beta-xylanase [Oscillospiraceae bacterium]